MQVLSLTPERINSLAEPERVAINQLVCPILPFVRMMTDLDGPLTTQRSQFMGTLGNT